MTWSIISRDERTGRTCKECEPLQAVERIEDRIGIIVASKFFAVGAHVPHIRTGVGAIAS